MIIISDMIENTQRYSQYQSTPDFSEFSQTGYYGSVRTDLSNIRFDLLYLSRESTQRIQTKRHALFWTEYLLDQGGNLNTIEKVDG